MPRISSTMQASDDRSLVAAPALDAGGVGRSLLPFVGAAALTCSVAYALPALAGARARFVSDRAWVRALDGGLAVAALWERLGIEDRTASATGYALTFDDGPHREGTPAVLEILAREGVRATFFLVGEQVRARPALAAEIVAAGHAVALHADRHRLQ